MNIVKVIPYGILGQWQTNLLLIDLTLLPVALLGVWLGHRIQKIISEAVFLTVCKSLLMISGVALVGKFVITL